MAKKDTDFLTHYNTENASTLFTPMELAEYLNIGKNRAYELLRSGKIVAFRIGKTWKVSRAAIDKYIMEQSGII